jgi:magnesium-transporting ATPase (P-type)
MKLNQMRVGWVGAFINLLYFTSPIIGMTSYIFTGATLYAVIKPFLDTWFPWMKFWVFILVAVIFVVFLLVVSYVVLYPSNLAFQNKQTYKHQNPMQRDLLLIKKKVGIPLTKAENAEAERLLKELEEEIKKDE